MDPAQLKCKLWIISCFIVKKTSIFFTLCLSKIYQFEGNVCFWNQRLEILELQLLPNTWTVRKLTFFPYDVVDSQGSQVPIENIFELFPGLEYYHL